MFPNLYGLTQRSMENSSKRGSSNSHSFQRFRLSSGTASSQLSPLLHRSCKTATSTSTFWGLAKCFDCRRRQVPVCNQKMADLPEERVIPGQPPFSHVGIDFFGPFPVKQGRSQVKRYEKLRNTLYPYFGDGGLVSTSLCYSNDRNGIILAEMWLLMTLC